ncbi:MAG: hypothetical protein MUD14_09630 [Hydrococcus sp. Prado102]|jgi:multidrug efflux pump subunit AcrB|nr:hypothetical protein [Hydrococcus sp. Prado102]
MFQAIFNQARSQFFRLLEPHFGQFIQTHSWSTYTANAPQKIIEVDRDRAKALQVDIDDILSTLQTFLGSRYVN